MFTIDGNICGDRVRIGRAIHQPPLTQDALARKVQLNEGLEMTKNIISTIEKGVRHVCDAELRALSIALGVSIDWLIGDTDNPKRQT